MHNKETGNKKSVTTKLILCCYLNISTYQHQHFASSIKCKMLSVKQSSAIYNVKNRTLNITVITIRYGKKDFKIIKCQLKLNGTCGV